MRHAAVPAEAHDESQHRNDERPDGAVSRPNQCAHHHGRDQRPHQQSTEELHGPSITGRAGRINLKEKVETTDGHR